MNSQYFANNPTTPSKEKTITYQIFGTSFHLLTDTNVFAKNGVDEGTDTLLKVILPLIQTGKVLDIGCGYGVIGLTLAYYNRDIQVTCSDINLRAVNLAKKNLSTHQLSKKVIVLHSDLYEKIEGKFDYIVSNPPIRAGNTILYKLYMGAYDHLKTSGCLYLVVRRKQGAESTVKYLEKVYAGVEVIKKHKGYWIIKATK